MTDKPTNCMPSWACVVLLGSTYRDAKFWKHELADELPDIADARELSTFSLRAFEGLAIRRAYITPNARRGPYYDKAELVIRRSLAKMRGRGADEAVIHLGGM